MRGNRDVVRFVAAGLVAGALLSGGALRAEDCGPADLELAVVERTTQDGDVILTDERRLRLAGLHLHGSDTGLFPKPGERVAIGLLGQERDRWARYSAMIFVLSDTKPPEWLHKRLLAGGAALIRPESDLGGCWDLLKAVEARHDHQLMRTPAESGRFTRVSGRVQRVGEGRNAHFITVVDRDGERITGFIQKRYLKRFASAGVDVKELRGQFIRMRGVRSVTNATVLPLTFAEQIEIMR